MATKKANGKLKLSILAAHLEEAKQGAGFDAFSYEEIATVLRAALPFKEEVPDHEHQDLIWKTIIQARSQGAITEKSLLAAFQSCQETFLKSPLRDFVFVATISISIRETLRKKALRVGSMVISDALPSRYGSARASKEAAIPEADLRPPNHDFVRLPVSARSEHEAEALAAANLDLIRASWNFSLNEGTLARITFPTRDAPINRIILGRCHSLHQRDGALAFRGHWRRTREALPPPSPSRAPSSAEWLRASQLHRSAVSRLRRHPYSEELKRGLIRYVRALDLVDGELCFLRLWSLVEFLTGSESQYDVTIRRILFLSKDREFARQVLENLRFQRNYLVHEGDPTEVVEKLVWPVKHYVEKLLRYHFTFGCKMSSLQEACQFLDMPADSQTLLRGIAAHRKALNFREGFGG